MVVSEKLRREVLIFRSRGGKQYTLAKRAGIHPTILSALLTGSLPVRSDDPRVLSIGRLVGVPAAECFEEPAYD